MQASRDPDEEEEQDMAVVEKEEECLTSSGFPKGHAMLPLNLYFTVDHLKEAVLFDAKQGFDFYRMNFVSYLATPPVLHNIHPPLSQEPLSSIAAMQACQGLTLLCHQEFVEVHEHLKEACKSEDGPRKDARRIASLYNKAVRHNRSDMDKWAELEAEGAFRSPEPCLRVWFNIQEVFRARIRYLSQKCRSVIQEKVLFNPNAPKVPLVSDKDLFSNKLRFYANPAWLMVHSQGLFTPYLTLLTGEDLTKFQKEDVKKIKEKMAVTRYFQHQKQLQGKTEEEKKGGDAKRKKTCHTAS